jgi:hypothetical protein
MAGFFIRNSGSPESSVSATQEFSRVHRFILINFLGVQANQFPWHHVKDISIPDKDIESLEIPTPGAVYKFPKQIKYGDLQIVWYGTPELELKLNEMIKENVHNEADGIRSDFNTIEVGLTDASRNVTVRYKFYNAYISNLKRSELTYTSSEFLNLTSVIKFSHYKILDTFESDFDSGSSLGTGFDNSNLFG